MIKKDLNSLSTAELKRRVDVSAAQFDEGMARIEIILREINRRRADAGQAPLSRTEAITMAAKSC